MATPETAPKTPARIWHKSQGKTLIAYVFWAWFKDPGSRFTVEGKADSRFLTVNHEPKTLIRYAVYDFGSIINQAELLPEIEPCQDKTIGEL